MAECECASVRVCVCGGFCVHMCVFVYVDIDPINIVGEFKVLRYSENFFFNFHKFICKSLDLLI